ncbi:MAG: ABC transporter substrate-binding protein [Actinomycetota bacterium]
MERHERTDSSRRAWRFAVALAVTAVALVGCGSDDDDDATTTTDPVEQVESTEPAPETTAPPAETTEAPREDTEPAAEQAEEAGDTVTVTDATGEITVPLTSRDVLALDEYTAVNLLSLGVTPIRAVNFFQLGEVDAILEAEGIDVFTGAPFTPNLEELSRSDASLIAGFNFPTIVEVRDTLDDEIAPTVLVDFLNDDWRAHLALLASVTGTGDRLEELEDSVDSAIEELAADIAAAGLDGATVSYLEETAGGISLSGSGRLAPSILERVGLARPAVEQVEGTGVISELSEETLGDHDAEFMIVETDLSTEPTVNDSPLRTADGVKVYVYGWSEDVVGSFRIIADLRRVLLDGAEPLGPDDQLEIWDEFVAP